MLFYSLIQAINKLISLAIVLFFFNYVQLNFKNNIYIMFYFKTYFWANEKI